MPDSPRAKALLRPSLFAATLAFCALTALPAVAAEPEAFLETASVKVRAEKPGLQPEAPPELVGARNEFVSFQVILNGGDTGLKGVTPTMDALQGPGTIPDVTLFRETYLDITRSSGGFGEKGRWPDGLVPEKDEVLGEARSAFPMDVPANESRAIWIDVLIPEDAPAGTYASSVELTSEGFQTSLPVSLRVVDATMPSTSSFDSAYILWDFVVCKGRRGAECVTREDRDVPLASIRPRLIRQGMQDFEWLKWVSEAGDPEFAREVARKLIPAASKVGDDGRAFDAARLELIARYEALQPEKPESSGEPPLPMTEDPQDPAELHPDPAKEPVALGCAAGGQGAFSFAAVAALTLTLAWRRVRSRRSSRWNRSRSAA